MPNDRVVRATLDESMTALRHEIGRREVTPETVAAALEEIDRRDPGMVKTLDREMAKIAPDDPLSGLTFLQQQMPGPDDADAHVPTVRLF